MKPIRNVDLNKYFLLLNLCFCCFIFLSFMIFLFPSVYSIPKFPDQGQILPSRKHSNSIAFLRMRPCLKLKFGNRVFFLPICTLKALYSCSLFIVSTIDISP